MPVLKNSVFWDDKILPKNETHSRSSEEPSVTKSGQFF